MMLLFSSQIGVLRAFPQAIRSTGYADIKVSLPDDNLDSADSIFFFNNFIRSSYSKLLNSPCFLSHTLFFYDVIIFESNRRIASISLSDKVDRVCRYQLCL